MTAITHVTLLIGAIIAIVGWGVSHTLTARRERDRFRREVLGKELDFALSMVEGLLDMALEYHSGHRDIALERKILITIDRLGHRIQNLPLIRLDNPQKSNLTGLIIPLKISITGLHFEDEHSGPLAANSDQLALCQYETATLENAILQLRTSCYKPVRFVVINYWTDAEDLARQREIQ